MFPLAFATMLACMDVVELMFWANIRASQAIESGRSVTSISSLLFMSRVPRPMTSCRGIGVMFMVENVVNDTSSSIAASERPSRVGWV